MFCDVSQWVVTKLEVALAIASQSVNASPGFGAIANGAKSLPRFFQIHRIPTSANVLKRPLHLR